MRLYDGRAEFYQYDTNQKLICDSCQVGEEIHFSNKFYKTAAVCLTYEFEGQVVVNVPNSYLMCSGELIVYRVQTDNECRSTIDQHIFIVNSRKKPSAYVYDETDVLNYTSLLARIEELERGGGSAKTAVISATRPDTADLGDFWFDTSTGVLKICTSIKLSGMAGYPPVPQYTNAVGVTVSDTAPSTANKGDMWYCTVDKTLYVCTGRDVTVMPPNGVPVWEPVLAVLS